MPDPFDSHASTLTSPARSAQAITPSDSAALAQVTRGLYVGQSGSVRVKMASGDLVTFAGMQGGMAYPLRVAQVLATGTTATGLVGLQ